MNQFDTNNRYDWTGHTGQTRDGSSNVRNDFNNTSTYSTNYNALLPSILSVATSTAAEWALSSNNANTTVNNTGNYTGLPPLQWNLHNSTNSPQNANTTNITSNNVSSFYTIDSTIKDLMGNLKINADNNLTSDDIDDLAFKYVQKKEGHIKPTYQPLY